MKNNRQIWTLAKLILTGILLAGSIWLLGEDADVFLKWWLMSVLLGVACYPLTSLLFRDFADRGWMVSKVLGVAFSGFLAWVSVTCGLLPFRPYVCLGAAVITGVACWGLGFRMRKVRPQAYRGMFTERHMGAMVDGELLFVLLFLLWTYFAGFRPAAYGTEKFMDYGFMMAMMRSDTLPARDLWYSEGTINYYYGGQYFAVFLTKLTGTGVEKTYNIMRTFVAAFAFVLPFTLVRQMLLDHLAKTRKAAAAKAGWTAALGGLLAGAGVSLAGNMHYVLVGKVIPWVKNLLGLPQGDYTYWFPNSTRYIGYYPEGNDKTIHEFPSYSFVLGDLHAHVVNVMFVLALICLVYAMVQRYARKAEGEIAAAGWRAAVRQALLEPYVWLLGFFIGLFHWTNYWDFVIYYVMGGLGVIYCNYLKYSRQRNRREALRCTALTSLIHAVWVLFLGTVFALPFTATFETMVNGIALAQNHTRPYQWWLIWGLPFLVTLVFMVCVFRDRKPGKLLPPSADFFGVILGFSAIGLILIPELVYVRDIYEKEYARSNTMFKLTYQAFMMFGMVMAYAFVRLWLAKKHRIRKALMTAGFVCFAGCCCYVGTAVHSWFGQVWNRELYQGLDATAFLETDFPEDAAAIRWLNDHVEGQPVVLEANGDSYSDYERVSAMTGLPTVLGWYVHEWLWRGNIEDLNEKSAQVEAIYTASDPETAARMVEELDVSYIFVGSMEREKYGDQLNDQFLAGLGEIVFRDEASGTYIVRVGER